MSSKNSGFPDDRTEQQRRRKLTDEQIRELESAGGVEGGMQAGSAGGSGEHEAKSKASQDGSRRSKP